jgi:hypothetical protein
VIGNHEVDDVRASLESIGQSLGIVECVSETGECGSGFRVGEGPCFDAHGDVDIQSDPCGLDACSQGVGLHHQAADESPPVGRQIVGDLKNLRPRIAPSACRLFHSHPFDHVRASCRVRIRCPAALLVRTSP